MRKDASVEADDMTDLDIYQKFVKEMTWDSTKDMGIYWTMIALTSEVGELAQIVEKIIRKNNGVMTDDHRAKLKDELGDVIWNVAKIANDLDIPLDEVIEDNISKLNARRYANEAAT